MPSPLERLSTEKPTILDKSRTTRPKAVWSVNTLPTRMALMTGLSTDCVSADAAVEDGPGQVERQAVRAVQGLGAILGSPGRCDPDLGKGGADDVIVYGSDRHLCGMGRKAEGRRADGDDRRGGGDRERDGLGRLGLAQGDPDLTGLDAAHDPKGHALFQINRDADRLRVNLPAADVRHTARRLGGDAGGQSSRGQARTGPHKAVPGCLYA